jgi:hypothetical protein
MNAGLPGLSLTDFIVDPASPNMLYCCSSRGMFRYESSFNPATDASDASIPAISIDAYPNPFSTGTTVEYEVASTAQVNLGVYDVAGRRVATLVDSRLAPGRYRADLRGAHLAAGVYFIKGTFGDRTVTKKCVLVK